MKNSENSLPTFTTQAFEAQAVCLNAALSNKKIPFKLKPEDQKLATSLLNAYRNGSKSRAFQLSKAYYEQVLNEDLILSAYRQIQSLALNGGAEFQIVMDSLKGNYGDKLPAEALQLSTQQALEILLLAITQSDKNSISYLRIDEITGKPRPTTFPLSQELIAHFLEPFGEQALAEKVLVFSKINVMGNPAALVAERYWQRKKTFETEKAAYEKAQAEALQRKNSAASEVPKKEPKQQAVEHISQELDHLLQAAQAPEAQQAVLLSFQVKQLRALLQTHQTQTDSFASKLSQIYAQQLTPAQSAELSSKLASRMKRLMTRMGSWKEEYWQEYQLRMQKAGLWEGQAWLDKWRADKTGKQVIEKTGKDYLIEEKPVDTVGDFLRKSERLKDKQKGLQMLSGPEAHHWIHPEESKAPPEIRRILTALSQRVHLDELTQLSFEPSAWEQYPDALKQKLYQIFRDYSQTDLDTIKQELLKQLSPEMLEMGQSMIAQVELQINRIAVLCKKELKLTFVDAVERLRLQQAEIQAREKRNSRAYQNSAAAKYGNYLES